jgi:hypothetical protein
MSAPAGLDVPRPTADVPPRPDTSLQTPAGSIWRRTRVPLLIVLLVLLVATVLAYLSSDNRHGTLDPGSADPQGGRALAQLLGQHGVRVTVATDPTGLLTGSAADTTVFVPRGAELTAGEIAALERGGADLVLVFPTEEALGVLTPGVRSVPGVSGTLIPPACRLPLATNAGNASLGGLLFDAQGVHAREVVGCYPDGAWPSLLRIDDGRRTVTLLGASDLFRNDELTSGGNAALTLGLLGAKPNLVWYYPTPPAPGHGDRSLFSLLPAGVRWGMLQAALAVGVLALWRMRRLGPVVPEPLPVAVRAAETVEGRGRLYRRAKARGQAAEALRSATTHRLRPLVGLPVNADPAGLTAVLAARTGRPEPELRELLFGSTPGSDTALIHLADALDALEKEVLHP